MKSTLTFEVDDGNDDFENSDELQRVLAYKKIIRFLSEFDEECLRNRVKYGDGNFSEEQIDAVDKIRSEFYQMMGEMGLDLDFLRGI